MTDLQMITKKRTLLAKAARSLREEGVVPGILYGQGKKATPIQIDSKQLEKVYQQAGSNQLVEVSLEDSQPLNVLFHDVQVDPMSRKIRHFDLYTVKMDEKIKTEVPIQFLSEAPAVHKLSAILVKNVEAVEVEALPANLPESIEVDLSGLDGIGDSIHVSDLKAGEGVEIITDPETLIVKTDPPRSEEEMAELEEEVEEGAEGEVISEHGGEETEESEEEKQPEEGKKPENAPEKAEDQSS